MRVEVLAARAIAVGIVLGDAGGRHRGRLAQLYLYRLMGVPEPRMTPQTVAVLETLLALPETGDGTGQENDVADEAWGFEISRSTGLAAGTLYPILARLVAAGWVADRWEDPEVGRGVGRPPRRYYRLTTRGRARATHASGRAATTEGARWRVDALQARPELP